MKLVSIVLVSLLSVAGAATAAVAAAPAASSAVLDCDNSDGVKKLVECATACAKNLVNGGHCGPQDAVAAVAGPDVGKIVDCTVSAVEQIEQGVTPMPCEIGSGAAVVSPPDVGNAVKCVESQVKQIASGVTPLPCDI